MGVKSFMARAWDSGKGAVTKVAGTLKSMATAVDDAWKNKAQPWIESKVGTDTMDKTADFLGHIGKKALKGVMKVGVNIIPGLKYLVNDDTIDRVGKNFKKGIVSRVSPGKEARDNAREEEIKKLIADEKAMAQGVIDSGDAFNMEDMRKGKNRFSKRSLYAVVHKGKNGKLKLRSFGRPVNLFTEDVTGRFVNKFMLKDGSKVDAPPPIPYGMIGGNHG